jgi:BirA family transcriptional regulator, biotin operon repressor / biotin---[acetyl-CoA-carboxylase] ligase
MRSNLASEVVGWAPAGDLLSIEQIRRRLVTDRVGFQIYLFGEVTSTNDVLRRLAARGTSDGTVVLAEAQTMGRGRFGKPWYSPPGVNLYASVLLRPSIQPAAAPTYAFIASLALTDAIWAEGSPAAIKWPNDILIDERKVGGALSSYAASGDTLEHVILGIGVNLNVDRATLRAALGPTAPAAGSLRDAVGRLIDRNAFTAAFLNFLEKWDEKYRRHGARAILTAWRERDALAGRAVSVTGPGERYRGRAVGFNGDGRLIVEDTEGVRHPVVAGEVAVLA